MSGPEAAPGEGPRRSREVTVSRPRLVGVKDKFS